MLFLAVSSPALAQDQGAPWFVGVGASRSNADFRPYYTYYGGGTPDQFENESHGLEVEVLAGRRHQVSDRLSLSFQGSAAFNSFSWSLSIPEEPADLKYSLPYRFAASVVPEVHFGRVSVYADVGGGIGRVRELKTTSDARVSRYEYDKIRPTMNVGGGVKVSTSGGIHVFAHLGHVRYASVEYDTFSHQTGMLPVVSKVEHVTDKPRTTGFTVGVIKKF